MYIKPLFHIQFIELDKSFDNVLMNFFLSLLSFNY